MLDRAIIAIAVVLGLLALINGVYMVVGPEPWYWAIPGVPDRGPFNQHFIRDIGLIYILIGGLFIYGAFYPRPRFHLWLMPTAWLTCHALFHFWEVAVGICGPESLIEDFAGVTLPAALAVVLTTISYRELSHA